MFPFSLYTLGRQCILFNLKKHLFFGISVFTDKGQYSVLKCLTIFQRVGIFSNLFPGPMTTLKFLKQYLGNTQILEHLLKRQD